MNLFFPGSCRCRFMRRVSVLLPELIIARVGHRHRNEAGGPFAYGFRRSVRMSGTEKRFITRYSRIVYERTQL